MRTYETQLSGGIRRTREFEKKGLAQFAVNVGTKCGHDCQYCSTGTLVRMHPSFEEAGESPFGFGYSIVDPGVPERVEADARRIRSRGMIQLCTIVDAWAPEAQAGDLGRRCLEAVLAEPGWTVRILTKNAAVQRDFDLIERYRDRVLVGLSLTGVPTKEGQLAAVEPNASRIGERMAALQEAHRRGLRTYGMLCPLLPGVADDAVSVSELVRFVLSCGAEEIFAEPVNARGPGLRLTAEALRRAGFAAEAGAVDRVRKRAAWSAYCVALVQTVQAAVEGAVASERLRFLLYPSNLGNQDLECVRGHDSGIVWL